MYSVRGANIMTIKQKIRKARVVYIFVRTSKGDGSHIKVSKSEVIKSLMGDEENDYFQLIHRDILLIG